MDVVTSKAGVPVRLTDERWFHIVENHDEVAGYYDQVLEAVEDPDLILQGYGGAIIAAKALGRRKYLMVIYRSYDERMVLSSPLLHVPSSQETNPMAKRSAVAQAIDNISDALPHLLRLPQRKAWIDYDDEADVLYIGLKRPQKTTDTKLLGDKWPISRNVPTRFQRRDPPDFTEGTHPISGGPLRFLS
jgi:hypothetical protein